MAIPVRVISFGHPLALLAAEAEGYFAAEGLAVSCEATPGSAVQMRGLIEGRWDVAHTAADNVMAYVNREDADAFVFLVGDLGLDQSLVVRGDVGDYAALRGQVLAVDAPDTGFALVLRRMLAVNGIGPGEFELRPVGNTLKRLEALRAGQAAGALLGSPHDARAIAAGFRRLQRSQAVFPLYPGLTAATTRRWAAQHRAELVGYTRAVLAGARWAADPAQRARAASLIARDQGIGEDDALAAYDRDMESRTRTLPPLDEVAAALEVVRGLRADLTGVGRNLDAYYDDAYMRAAQGGGAGQPATAGPG